MKSNGKKNFDRENLDGPISTSEEDLSLEDLMHLSTEADSPIGRMDARWAAALRLMRRELEKIADDLGERSDDESNGSL